MHRMGNGGAHFTAMAEICEENTFPTPNEDGQIKDQKPTDTALPSPVVTAPAHCQAQVPALVCVLHPHAC